MQERETTPSYSLDYIFDNLLGGFGRFQWVMLVLCGTGYLAVCSELLLFVFIMDPLYEEWPSLGQYAEAWLLFCTGLSSLISGYAWGWLSDKYGRKLAFIITVGISGLAGFASAFAWSFPAFVGLRMLTSVGTGGILAVDWALFLEFTPTGKSMITITAYGSVGVLVTTGLAWAVIPTIGWRYLVALCACPILVVAVIRAFVRQESPRFLAAAGKFSECKAVLQAIQRTNKVPELPVHFCIVCEQKRNHATCSLIPEAAALFSPANCRTTFLLTIVWVCQSIGYWGVTAYLPQYYTEIGLNSYATFFAMVAAELPGLALAAYLIDCKQIGRLHSLQLFLCMTAIFMLMFSFITSPLPLLFILALMVYFCMIPVYGILFTYSPGNRSLAMDIVNNIPGLITAFLGAQLLSSSLTWLYPFVWSCFFIVGAAASLFFKQETALLYLDAPRTLSQENTTVYGSIDYKETTTSVNV